MGTFENIRRISPWFFGIFAALLIAYFIFTSGGSELARQRTDRRKAPIAEVNDVEILWRTYDQKVSDRTEQQRKSNKDADKDIDTKTIRDQVWDELIDFTIMKKLATEAGILITDDIVKDIMIENPPDAIKQSFRDSTGKFNKQFYLQLVTNFENFANLIKQQNPNATDQQIQREVQKFRKGIIEIQEAVRQQKLAEGLMVLVNTAQGVLSPGYLREKYINDNSLMNVDYVPFLTSDIKDNEVKVTEAELKDYYKKNKKYLKQKEERQIKYVNFPLIPTADDTAKANRRVALIFDALSKAQTPVEKDSIFDIQMDKYNGEVIDFTLVKDLQPDIMTYVLPLNEGEITGPVKLSDGKYFFRLDKRRSGEQEVVKASHILVKFNNNKDSAKAATMDILRRAKGGEDFATMARTLSEDKGSGQRGGELGYFGKGKMVKPFEDAAFAANVGDIVGPVESQYGYHIIKIEDKQSDEISYSQIKITTKLSTPSRNLIRANAYSFYKQVEDGENFDTLASRLNLKAIETGFFENKRPILGSKYLTDKTFEAEKGQIMDPFELDRYGIIIVLVNDIKNAGLQSFEDVKSRMEREVKNIKKLDMLKERAEKAFMKASSAGNINVLADSAAGIEIKQAENLKNNGIIPGLGQEFAFTAYCMKAPVGTVSGPLRGERGYYIIQVKSRDIPGDDKIAKELPGYAKKMAGNTRNIYYQWFSSVKTNADIKDFRSDFYTEY